MTSPTIKTLETLVREGRSLLGESEPVRAHSDFEYWDHNVAEWLDQHYPGTGLSANWSSQQSSILVSGGRYYDDHTSWMHFKGVVQKRLHWLSQLGTVRTKSSSVNNATSNSSKIFVVHGHDEAVRETVARFLEKLGLEPIILHEQPNKGRTIIEKFVDYSDVRFAVVLLTADDMGGARDTQADSLNPRARQNVVLELGFFLGKLGRDRVCAIYQSGVELPSDFSGVAYLVLDTAGAWRLQLARELKAAGINVDMNLAI